MYLNHEKSPPLPHHTTCHYTWFQTRVGYRYRNLDGKFDAASYGGIPLSTSSDISMHSECLQLTRPGTVRGDNQGFRSWTKNKETSTTVLDRAVVGANDKEVIHTNV